MPAYVSPSRLRASRKEITKYSYALNPANIARIDPTTGTITEYPAVSPSKRPYGITTGPDGNLWFTDGGSLAKVGVATLSP
ncbi:MAG TPA: hypothetical protein VKP69_32255, partial [Isosphaeraceae bacterium]|nr:hypothetical protein [Isosphaeraceae bacterium]